MRPGSGHSGTRQRPAGCNCNWKAVVKIVAVLVLCHLLSVIVLSAQSTAAGGPLVLFPLGALWRTSIGTDQRGVSAGSNYEQGTEGEDTRDSESAIVELVDSAISIANKTEDSIGGNVTASNPNNSTNSDLKNSTSSSTVGNPRTSTGNAQAEKANVMPNPIRLPTLPKSPPPPPPSPPPPPISLEAKDAANQDAEVRDQDNQQDEDRTQDKKELLDQLRGRRKEVERLMAKRRAEREGISIAEAERTQTDQAKEAVDVAVLAVEKPQENVKEAFSGGQNGRFIPAPKILYNLFKKDDRPKEDKSWLDRVTDSIIDKLELRWEDDEEARMEDDEEPIMSSDFSLGKDTTMTQRPAQKQWPIDECATALQIPKIAMMYLTKGELYHTETWKLWFEFAHGHLPLAQVKQACKTPGLLEKAQQLCQVKTLEGSGERVLANQHLFNVYVHVGLNNQEFEGFPQDSLFYNRDIIDRVQVEWGRHSLVTATRNMMKQALQEPLNKKLILLSEAGIPLYPPTALYHQLITEEKSRINSCIQPGWERHTHRWTDKMETPQMRSEHWRKSSQWFGLNREHAELIMSDAMINKAFYDNCYPTTEEGWWRDCFSDEHYFATLLAVLGRENETDCKGFMMHVDWSRGGAHPRTYDLREISAARLRLLRMPTENCGYPSAIKTASHQFVKQETLNSTVCNASTPEYSNTLGPQCPLFARKFAPETAQAITTLVSECKNRLKIVHGNDCHRRLSLMKKYM